MNFLSKTPRGLRRFAACAVVVLAAPTSAMAAVAALNGASSATYTHNPGGPGGSITSASLTIQGTASPTLSYSGTRTFAGGTSKAKAGVGRNQSATLAKLVFPTGVGADQTDLGHLQSASSLRIDFTAIFDITGAGSFGPAINGVFSVPFGATIGPGGSAVLTTSIVWEAKIIGQNGNNFFQVRAPFSIGSPGAGTFNNGGGSPMSVLTSFTAPAAPFSPPSILGGVGNQLRVSGFVQFAANNENAPVTVNFPRDFADGTDPNDPDPFDIYQQGTPDPLRILELIPEVGFEVDELPEPSSLALLAGGALLLGRRRRQPQA